MDQTRRCDWLPELVHVDGAILRVKGLICLVFLLLSHTPRHYLASVSSFVTRKE